MAQNKSAYCPSCKFFGQDCSPDPEEYSEPCDSYEPREEEDHEFAEV